MFSYDSLARPEPLTRRVYAYGTYRLGDRPYAEDASSDAFERTLGFRSSFDPHKGEPADRLTGIARGSVDSHLAAQPPVAADLLDSPAPGELEEATANG